MSCFHPKAGVIGKLKDGSNAPIDFLNKYVYEIHPYYKEYRGQMVLYDTLIYVPCKKCIGCRMDYSENGQYVLF